MPRPQRIEEPGAYYHVVSRGNNKQVVFDEVLRAFFLTTLDCVARRQEWRIFAWAMMDNHYHVVLQIGDAGLARGMCQLNTQIARASNGRFARIDHCFGRRYWSAQLETQHHLLLSVRYAMWNPIRAGLCSEPSGSTWTSYRSSIGLDPTPRALARVELQELFHPRREIAHRVLSDFVSEGRVRCQAPWDGPRST